MKGGVYRMLTFKDRLFPGTKKPLFPEKEGFKSYKIPQIMYSGKKRYPVFS